MSKCVDCGGDAPDGYDEPLCYACLYKRCLAYRAEYRKNFGLLCHTETALAAALMNNSSRSTLATSDKVTLASNYVTCSQDQHDGRNVEG